MHDAVESMECPDYELSHILLALSIYIIPVLLVVIPAVASIVFDFILERLFRRYMSPEDLEREEENDMYAS